MRRTLAFALLCGALAGCGGKGSLEQDWPGPPKADSQGRVPVAAFNAYLDDYPDYAESPETLAVEFVKLGDREASTTTLVAQANGSVTVTLLGLADDSVASERYQLVVEKNGDDWRLTSAVRTQRCRVGRGHQDYSAALCL